MRRSGATLAEVTTAATLKARLSAATLKLNLRDGVTRLGHGVPSCLSLVPTWRGNPTAARRDAAGQGKGWPNLSSLAASAGSTVKTTVKTRTAAGLG